MHDQRNDPRSDASNRTDVAVLHMLLDSDLGAPMSVVEVAREMRSEVEALDSIARLHGAGLIHRCDEFVFATHAARYYRAIHN
ncbi:MAG: hypothetical protein QOJ97_228 [Solirubrobacteraceae bacterium]|nr:hypothetical protein [Solirubrobacteraceae bacterium]